MLTKQVKIDWILGLDDCVNVEKKKQRITREKETKKRRDGKKEDMNKEE